jgi:hypothetical protein
VELETAEMAAADGEHLVAAGQIVVSNSTIVSPHFRCKGIVEADLLFTAEQVNSRRINRLKGVAHETIDR